MRRRHPTRGTAAALLAAFTFTACSRYWYGELGAAINSYVDFYNRMGTRLQQLEDVLSERDWLAAGRFTVADLLMADVLRVPKVRAFGNRPATEAYVARATSRPAFKKAHADQLAHFEAADELRT